MRPTHYLGEALRSSETSWASTDNENVDVTTTRGLIVGELEYGSIPYTSLLILNVDNESDFACSRCRLDKAAGQCAKKLCTRRWSERSQGRDGVQKN